MQHERSGDDHASSGIYRNRFGSRCVRVYRSSGKSWHKVYIGHEASQIEGADAIVYSAAIKPTNPEMAAALAKGMPTIERSVLLGMISGHFEEVVGIAGCHGKTTITSMLGLVLLKAQKDPTIM